MKEMDYYNSFWYKATKPVKRLWFKFLLNRGKLIKVDDRHRNIGKTYMMIQKAIDEDIPIIAGSQMAIDNIKRHANSVEVYGFARNFTGHVIGQSFPNGILIDESVDSSMIPELEAKFDIRGGFIANYKESNK